MVRHAETLKPPFEQGSFPKVSKRRVIREQVPDQSTPKVKRVKKRRVEQTAKASGGDFQRTHGSEDVLEDVDELILSIDSGMEVKEKHEEDELVIMDEEEGDEAEAVTEAEDSLDDTVIPWMDRYDTTERLVTQLEETLRHLEQRGVNLTTAWDMANTARSLLDSADVVQALIYANRSFRMALEVHRLQDGGGGAAS